MKCLHVFLIIFCCFLLPAKALAGNSEISERLVERSNPNILSEDPIAEFGGFDSHYWRYIMCNIGVSFYQYLLQYEGEQPVLNLEAVKNLRQPCLHYLETLAQSIYEEHIDKNITFEIVDDILKGFHDPEQALERYKERADEIYRNDYVLSIQKKKRIDFILDILEQDLSRSEQLMNIHHTENMDEEVEIIFLKILEKRRFEEEN